MKLKRASKDFSVSDLPSNRKEVFFDCIKNRYRYLLRAGIILFVTMIPFLFLCFMKSLSLAGLQVALDTAQLTEDEYASGALMYSFLYDLLIIVSTFILSIGLSGMTRVIRQIAWEEPLFFSKDFGDGIKMNYKHICAHVLVLSIIYMISDLSLFANMGISVLKYVPYAIFLFVALPAFLYNLVQTNIYDINNAQATKNSLLLFVKSVPVCVLFSLAVSLLIFIGFIPNTSIRILIYILLVVFATPLYYLAWFLYSSFVLDKYVNKEFYPEIVDKGITRRVKEEINNQIDTKDE